MHVRHPRRQGHSSHRVLGPRKGRDQLVLSLNAEIRAHSRGNLQNLSRKKVSRNTITYGHQREGPSALWKPAPIRTGKQASKQEGHCLSVKGTFKQSPRKAVSSLLSSPLWQQGEGQRVTFCMDDVLASRDC